MRSEIIVYYGETAGAYPRSSMDKAGKFATFDSAIEYAKGCRTCAKLGAEIARVDIQNGAVSQVVTLATFPPAPVNWILEWLHENNRSIAWLARKVGMKRQTLHAKVATATDCETRRRLSFDEWQKIKQVTG